MDSCLLFSIALPTFAIMAKAKRKSKLIATASLSEKERQLYGDNTKKPYIDV